MDKDLIKDIFQSIDETIQLIESFPQDEVKGLTTESPSAAFAKVLMKNFLNKEQ